MRFLRRHWMGLLFCALGLFVLIAGSVSYWSHLAYSAAGSCPQNLPASGCRYSQQARVTGAVSESGRAGPSTAVELDAGGFPYHALFDGDDLPARAVHPGQTVTIEVWHDKVTRMTVLDHTYESYGTQSQAWIGVLAGLGLSILGAVFLRAGM